MTEVIVEIGNTHEGSLGIAKSLVDMVKTSGARTAKFQLHIPEFEGMPDEPFRVKFSDQDITRQEYWKRVNFSTENWIKLSKYCEDIGIEFLCTPFSIEAAKLLFENGLVRRWKIGSGNATDWPLIDYVSSTKLPLIISTGLISESEIHKLRERLKINGSWAQTTLLHCVSKYPVRFEHIDLHLMKSLMLLDCPVGYSDHSGNVLTGLASIALGASILEVHMTPHRNFFGPDVSSSLTPEEIQMLIAFSKHFPMVLGQDRTKENHFAEVESLRALFRKGIYLRQDLPAGTVVTMKDLIFLKPVRGIDVVELDYVLGRRTTKNLSKLHPIDWSDLQNNE